jgi:hypothetical protein
MQSGFTYTAPKQALICTGANQRETDVITAYKTSLGRCPDQPGLSYYSNGTESAATMTSELAASPEGQLWASQGKPGSRFMPNLCDNNLFVNYEKCLVANNTWIQNSLGSPSGGQSAGTCYANQVYPPIATIATGTPQCAADYQLFGNICKQFSKTCPTGTTLSGDNCYNITSDISNFVENSACENVGTESGSATYVCKNGGIDECQGMPPSCSKVSSTCIDTLEMANHSQNGKCVATNNTYSCTTPAYTLTSTKCGYTPMCFNGNCFTPPGTQCKGTTIDSTQTDPKSCTVKTPSELRQCSLTEKTNSSGVVTGYTPGSDCASINTSGASTMNCTMLQPLIDPDTGHYPSKLTYSCVGTPVEEAACATISSTAGCSQTTTSCADYQCLDSLSFNGSNQEQAGVNTTTIVGSVSGGAVPLPKADANTCQNKGACLLQTRNFSCSTTTTTPGDECTTDLSKVLVSMETARQAGAYMDPAKMKIFSGEFSRCDRRAVGLFGANLGSKSCCNIDSPDPKNNAQLFGSPLMQGVSLLGSGISAGSSYMYDYMMSSEKFVTAAQDMWAAGALTDDMAQQGLNIAQSSAESLANFNFSPSVSLVPGLSVGYGAVNAGGAAVGTTLSSGSAVLGAGTSTTVVTGVGTTATTTTVAGVSTTTTTTQIGSSGFNISYNPTMLYITAAMMAYQAYQAALACDEEDYKSSTKGKAKLCYDTGTWCESKDCGLFGCTCTKYRTGKCCYNSKLARIINQQGRAQLGLDMRACDGFTVAQIQQLDWSRIDLTEFIADMLAQAQQSAGAVMNATTQTGLQNKLTTSTKANGAAKMQPKLPISQ